MYFVASSMSAAKAGSSSASPGIADVLLSANLGVMNLLPLPALDGGRLVFLIIEAIRRKPVNREIEGRIHFAGLMLLMALMVVVMYNDILKIF